MALNVWKVTTTYVVDGDPEVSIFWYPTEYAATLAARGFRLGGRSAVVTRDTSNVR